jgi:hypothetical protein
LPGELPSTKLHSKDQMHVLLQEGAQGMLKLELSDSLWQSRLEICDEAASEAES